ncbi:MAG TPA: cytochrome c peroxidase [Flavisolibacter sp.]|nr:cytochrome c peroxidase [Flavisolibacter sp.]
MKSWFVISVLFVFIIAGSLCLNGCKKNNSTPFHTTRINFVVPTGFPQPVYNFQNNPTTEEGFQLGRKLFYEGRLSLDGNYPCSSCHQQVAAFTTYNHDRSHGYNHTHTLRNSPGINNLAWYSVYLQDGGSASIEDIARNHITNPMEMAETMDHVVNKLKDDTSYQRMFRAAFGDGNVTQDRILNALKQFVINMVSANSKYDKMLSGSSVFSSQEQNGYQVFKSKCNSCHAEPLFSDFSFRNTGLDLDPFLNDYGRMRITNKSADSLKFRVPSLRNLDLTSYYGHDGRFSIFRMMIDHYRTGIIQSTTLDPSLRNGITMTDVEENDLVEFLFTLSDSSYLTNPRYSNIP